MQSTQLAQFSQLVGNEQAYDNRRYEGKLKFFDQKNNFGFITTVVEGQQEDIFVYGSEFENSGISLQIVKQAKKGVSMNLRFNIVYYFGKYKNSKKAVNLEFIQ